MRITFVTGNAGKVKEAQARLAPLGVEVVGQKRDLEELQADGLADVARHKATTLLREVPPPYFCEDAGLFVDALAGFPGVYSHYVFRTLGCAGVLRLLEGKRERGAHFEAAIAYVDPRRKLHLVSGRADGSIPAAERGANGFGFDPIFVPEGSDATFAELDPPAKGALSHRGRALDALAGLLSCEPKV